MFTPTKEQLEELGFEDFEWVFIFENEEHSFIFDFQDYSWSVKFYDDPYEIKKHFFPKDKESLEDFIYMLTKPTWA